ncbi:hypothetical protein MPH_12442 [Macrophomina phaseolina MS6]|uniref:Rhodopsin domain-containing protein n=2 Tax=Macrophomina phaseolina TaxID=35725 RepID=K2RKE8_MACPH|nr:hypothetical protein MPH_12442 [Macrophomina phaseolina MS6]KAH7042767.1 hypothetical protein B0J12DRAFT_579098 [Macrophomina phaseolina]
MAPLPAAAVEPITELWTLYSFGTLAIFLRLFCRWRLVGIQNFKPDDFLVVLAWAVYTSITVLAHIFILDVGGKHTSLLTPAQRIAMPVSERPIWEYGSKLFMAGQITYVAIVWILKLNMLFFYQRLVRGLWVEKCIIPAMGLVVTAGFVIVLLFALVCRPFGHLFQVYPDPGEYCVPQNTVFFYSILALNLTTDLVIVLIPIPVIGPLQLPLLRRIGLCFLFGLGAFCMVAAILRIVFVFGLKRGDIAAMWTLREDFVAIFVGQAPMVVPIFSSKFWRGQYGQSQHKSGGISSGTGPYSKSNNNKNGSEGHELQSHKSRGSLGGGLRVGKKPDPYSITQAMSESQEEIVAKGSTEEAPRMVVTVQRTVDVESVDSGGRGPERRVERWL